MTELIKHFQKHENRLVKEILPSIKGQFNTKNLPFFEETLHRSIRELTTSISEGLKTVPDIPYLRPDEKTDKDSFISFGVREAQRYKKFGITLADLLVIFKYARQASTALILDHFSPGKTDRLLSTVERCFDRIEIGICEEWTNQDNHDPHSTPDFKQDFRQIFNSYSDPVIGINKKNEILYLNNAAVGIIEKKQFVGIPYPGKSQSESSSATTDPKFYNAFKGKQIFTVLPWLKKPLNELLKQKNPDSKTEYSLEQKFYELHYTKVSTLSDKNETGIITLRDISDLKKAQKALSDSEAKLSSIIRVAPAGIGVVVDRVIKNVNDRFCEMTGYTSDEMINKNSRFLYPDQTEYERVGKEKYNQFLKSGSGKILTRLVRKDGKIIDVLLISTPIDRKNLSRGVMFTVLDITDEKRTEKALKASQKMLRSILDTIPVRVFWKDLDSVYTGCNLLFAKDAGFVSPEKIIGKKDSHMSWRSEAEKYIAEDKQVIKTGNAKLIFEDPRIMPDGNIRWFKTSKIPMRDNNGKIMGILGCYEDVTEHKKIVKALKESETQYRSLFEDSPISLWEEDFSEVKKIIDNLIANGITDLDGHLKNNPEIIRACARAIKVLNINQATQNIYKSNSKKELFTNLENIFSEDSFAMLREEIVAFTGGKTRYIDETVEYNLQGDNIWSQVNVIIPPGHEKTWSKVLVSVIDITEQKLVEKALRESEQKYRLFFENAYDGILIMKGDEFLDCNPKILEIFKCGKEQIIGNTPYNLSPPVQPDGKSSKVKALELIKTVEAGKTQVFEWVHTRPDDGEFTAEVSLTPFILENQNLTLAILRDITERKLAEKTLRFTQFSIDHSGDAAYWMGPDAHFVYVNETACRLLGYTKEELFDMTVFDIDPNFNSKNWKQHWQEIEGRKSFVIESIHKKKSGELLPVEITINYVNFMGKKYNCAFGRDISERKRAEKAILDSEKRYRTLFETMKQGVVYQNVNGEIISANPAAETILGLSEEQMNGLSSYDSNWDTIHEDGSKFPGDTHPAMMALKTGKEIKNVVMGVFNPKENAHRWININSIPQSGESNKPIQVYSTFADITERKLTEDKLRNYAQTQQVLLQEVNHRVKNNLAAIISVLHKEEDRAANKGYTDHLPVLQNLERRVNGLLTVHSILSSIKWQPVELSQLCEKVVSSTLHGSPLYKKIKLEVEESLIKVNSNVAHYLTIVLNELATNSLKYALHDRDTAKIRIYFRKGKKYIILHFHDDGPGFPDKILKDYKNESNIGFELIHGIVYHSLTGKLEIYNKNGAVIKIRFVNETEFQQGDFEQ